MKKIIVAYHKIMIGVIRESYQIYVDDIFTQGSVWFRTWNSSDAIFTDMQIVKKYNYIN